jgi:hypothetical protein
MLLLDIVMLEFLVMHGSLDGMFCMLYKVFYVHYVWLEQIWGGCYPRQQM